jgi:hypothetical protein
MFGQILTGRGTHLLVFRGRNYNAANNIPLLYCSWMISMIYLFYLRIHLLIGKGTSNVLPQALLIGTLRRQTAAGTKFNSVSWFAVLCRLILQQSQLLASHDQN